VLLLLLLLLLLLRVVSIGGTWLRVLHFDETSFFFFNWLEFFFFCRLFFIPAAVHIQGTTKHEQKG